MRSRSVRWVLLVVFVALVGGAIYILNQRGTSQRADTITVRRGNLATSVEALGRVEPVRARSLSTGVSGTVARVPFAVGDDVAEGTVLLELDTSESLRSLEAAQRVLDLRLRQRDEALAAPRSPELRLATARFRRATVARARAQAEYDDIADQPDAESSDEALALAEAKLAYEISEAELDRLLEGPSALDIERLGVDVLSAEDAVAQAQRRVQEARIIAPFAGTILNMGARPGEHAHGFSPLIEFADLEEQRVVAEIGELDVAATEAGQSTSVRLDAFPGVVLTGTVTTVLPALGDVRGATTYRAHIDVDWRGLTVRPGMGANVRIVTQTREGTLLVPRRAVERVGRHQVVTLLEGRNERQIVVETGLSSEADIEILSGLSEGDLVVIEQ